MAYRPRDSCCFCVCHESGQITLQAVDNNNMEMSRMEGARRERREEGYLLERRVQIRIGWIDPQLLSRERTVWPDTLHSQVLSLSTVASGDGVWWLVCLFLGSFCVKKEEPLWRPVHLEVHFFVTIQWTNSRRLFHLSAAFLYFSTVHSFA